MLLVILTKTKLLESFTKNNCKKQIKKCLETIQYCEKKQYLEKQYLENFAVLSPGILKLFTRDVCEFPKK